MSRKKVFVSYSHKDRAWLDRLSVHLALLERRGLIHIWSDTRIAIGADWQMEIENALAEAKVAVLLISPEFLASRYIWEEEMPRIIAHSKQGMEVLPLIVRPCAWRLEEFLAKSQARPSGGRSLSIGSEAQIDLDITALVYELATRVGNFPEAITTSEWELAEQHQASTKSLAFSVNTDQQTPKQAEKELNETLPKPIPEEVFGLLPKSWISMEQTDFMLRLTIYKLEDRIFTGSIEYLEEDTVIKVKGHFEGDVKEIGSDLLSEFGSPQASDTRLGIIFREVEYEKKGSRPVRLDGEYRGLVSNLVLDGAWFFNDGGIGRRLILKLEK